MAGRCRAVHENRKRRVPANNVGARFFITFSGARGTKDMNAVYQGVDGAYSQLVIAHYLREHGIDMPTLGVAQLSRDGDRRGRCAGRRRRDPDRERHRRHRARRLRPAGRVRSRSRSRRFIGAPITVCWACAVRRLRDVREVLGHPLVLAECGAFLAGLDMRARFRAKTPASRRAKSRAAAIRRSPRSPRPLPRRSTILIELAAHCSDDPRTYSRFLIVRPRHAARTNPMLAVTQERATARRR